MKSLNEIAVVVQARENSERVPFKMSRGIQQVPLASTSLLDIVLEKLTSSDVIQNEHIYLSAHEDNLIEIGERYPINIHKRSWESANVDSGIDVLFDWWDKLPYKYVVMVSGCNPFLKLETIESFFNKYMFSKHDGMFSVVERKNYFWNTKGEMLNQWPEGQDLLNTKAVETTYEAGHCLYGSKMSDIGEGKWVGSWTKKDDPVLFPVSQFEAFDIDEQWQFDLVESYYAKKN